MLFMWTAIHSKWARTAMCNGSESGLTEGRARFERMQNSSFIHLHNIIYILFCIILNIVTRFLRHPRYGEAQHDTFLGTVMVSLLIDFVYIRICLCRI